MRYTPRSDCQIPTLADIYEKFIPEAAGRFVEVGAFDGVAVSNTVFLAEAGWKGIYIEPHPTYAMDCVRNHSKHPNIEVVNVAVSDVAGNVDLYVIGECSTLVWDKNAIDWGGNQANKITVRAMTLDAILEGLKWEPEFELMVIDVEQNELKVLKGFSIRRWLPRVVIIEAHEHDPAPERNCKGLPISLFFDSNGYHKIYADHINSIFVRNECV